MLLGLASLMMAATQVAQAPDSAPVEAPAEAPATPAVVDYPPSFFADARPNTALDMLSRVPGFSVDGGGGGRGFGAGGNVLIDGERPSSKSDSLSDILRRIPASQVVKIELIRGGRPDIDMQGRPVVANVIRKAGGGVKGAVVISAAATEHAGIGPAARLELQKSVSGRTVEGSVFVQRSEGDGAGDGPRNRVYFDGVTPEINSDRLADSTFDLAEATGVFEGPIGAGRLRLNAMVNTNSRDYLALDRRTTQTDRDENTREETSGELGLRYSRDIAAIGRLEISALQQLREFSSLSEFTSGATVTSFGNDRTSGESIARAAMLFTPVIGVRFNGGVETAYNWLETASSYTYNGAPVSLANASIRVEEMRTEAFGAATWSPLPSLSLEAGLRYETSNISSEGAAPLDKRLSYWKPRALATWALATNQQLSFRIEREVSQLSFGDFSASASLANGSVVSGNPDLEPETSWVYEAKYELRFDAKGVIALTLVRRDIADVVDRNLFFVPGSPPSDYEAADNVGDAVRSAFVINTTLPLDRVHIPGGLLRVKTAWADSEMTDPITGQTRKMSHQQEFDWDVRFSQDLEAFNLVWGVDVFGPNQMVVYRPREVTATRFGTHVNLFLEQRVRPELTLRVEVRNILDRKYFNERQVYTLPRDIGPLTYLETRRHIDGRGLYASLRRSF